MLFVEAENHRCKDSNEQNQPNQFLISDPVHRATVNQQIADNPTAKSCREGQNKNADRITLHANTDKNARKSKGHNTDHVGQIQKVYFVERLKSRSDIHS